jgi:hypothetical protein
MLDKNRLGGKVWGASLLSLTFLGLFVVVYLVHIWWLPVNVVFYSALLMRLSRSAWLAHWPCCYGGASR